MSKLLNILKKSRIKTVLSVALATGFLALSAGCDYSTPLNRGSHNFPGTRNPQTNPTWPGLWDGLMM
ncbi:MAG: hypothetical protein ABII12_17000 [Planctomycetota bacterium]